MSDDDEKNNNKKSVRSQKYQFKFCETLIKSDAYFDFQKSAIDDIGVLIIQDKIKGIKEQINMRVKFILNTINIKLDDYIEDSRVVMNKTTMNLVTAAIQKDNVIQKLYKKLNNTKTQLETRYEILQLK